MLKFGFLILLLIIIIKRLHFLPRFYVLMKLSIHAFVLVHTILLISIMTLLYVKRRCLVSNIIHLETRIINYKKLLYQYVLLFVYENRKVKNKVAKTKIIQRSFCFILFPWNEHSYYIG